MKVLLITPPMTQINTPYPATAYLTSFLRTQGHDVRQVDMGLELATRLFSRDGLLRVKDSLHPNSLNSENVQFFINAFNDYQDCIDHVITFLRGNNPTLALRLAQRQLVPEGPRFLHLNNHPQINSFFGVLGTQDKAKYIGSLFLDDISDVIKSGIDSSFEFSRYAEELASSQIAFSPLYQRLKSEFSLIDQLIKELTLKQLAKSVPDVVGLSVPFPGNFYAALRIASVIKENYPETKVVMGGGFVNTELRELSDKRLFEFIDYLIFDDGEKPLKQLLDTLGERAPKSSLIRTWTLENGEVKKYNSLAEQDIPFKNIPAPTYDGLNLDGYISMMEMPNPMHRMWSDYRWNKMILAHGCYWKKCTFCDTSLDYIKRFEPARAEQIVDNIEKLIRETGQTGFHFVDEAAPPALLKSISEIIIQRGLKITWWGNLRFDSQFTPEVAELMADAGCVAVTGGLEVASPRILSLINKGLSLEQVASVTRNFRRHGILVHAYLMYGFPTQTEQETIDSLEIVRQLFLNDCINSAFWHRFIATVHSPVGKNPDKFGITLTPSVSPTEGVFAKNAVPFVDPTQTDHELLGVGLKKAVYNFMHGIGLSEPLQYWFEEKVTKPTVKKNYVTSALKPGANANSSNILTNPM